jgi:HEAT repeat protein
MPIDEGLQARARQELETAFASSSAVIRAQALEASVQTKDPKLTVRAAKALSDADPLVRFAGAMAVGDAKIVGLYRRVFELREDVDPQVALGVRYALHRLGDRRLSQEIADLTRHPSPEVRGTAALVLGRLGEPSAVRVLRTMLTDAGAGVRLQAAEALWLLGDRKGLETVVAGLISPFSDEQLVSTLALAGPRDRRVESYLAGRLAFDKDRGQYVEVQLAAARGLGMLGSDAGFGLALDQSQSADARIRTMAALALGEIRRTDAQPALERLLSASEPEVRLASATALLMLATPR